MQDSFRKPASPDESIINYRATRNLRAVQILFGHSKIENTVRYPCIAVEDALALAETNPRLLIVGGSSISCLCGMSTQQS